MRLIMNYADSGHGKKTKEGTQMSLSDGFFYEIEYDASPMKGVGKFVLKPQVIKPPAQDEIRALFRKMREIGRLNQPSTFNYSRFYDKRVQVDNAAVFYKQAQFMKDFEDDYADNRSFSGYFPYYQMLGYEQLRTYFTWRTLVRKGVVSPTSLSYVFLYLYELLSNIGVNSPQDGLKQLTSFWYAYKVFDSTLDRYVLRWLKDYHIYYDLPQGFSSFVKSHQLQEHYPNVIDPQNNFELFCKISKYDISKSTFFTDTNRQLIMDCFDAVLEQLRQSFETSGCHFEHTIFSPTKKIMPWKPFKDALFYPWYTQNNKRVILSDNEIYLCKNNVWTFSTTLTSETGRQFMGFVMKHMESILRHLLHSKHKLKANRDVISPELLIKLEQSGPSLEQIIETATLSYYKEATKKVVTVNHEQLKRIREEALSTQEALIVEDTVISFDLNVIPKIPETSLSTLSTASSSQDFTPLVVDSWSSFKSTLSDKELDALAIILQGDCLKTFVDKHDMMLEVFVDAINEKAFDTLGDNVIDEALCLYDDYIEQIKEMVG
jgi:hypothetical protein